MQTAPLPDVASLSALRALFAERLHTQRTAQRDTEATLLLRCELPVAPCDPLLWLDAQPHDRRVYWSSRDGSLTAAGVGAADLLSGTTAAEQQRILHSIAERVHHTRARYYGGGRFSLLSPADDLWRPFGGTMFTLPRVELVQTPEQTTLAVQAYATNPDQAAAELLAALEMLRAPAPAPGATSGPDILARTDVPDRNGWQRNIAAALASFERGDTMKIVLARRATLHLREPASPLGLLVLLRDTVRNAFVFCFETPNGSTFLGATPERLYRRDGTRVYTEAVAGTRRRGATDGEDAALRHELLHSAKDLHEHDLVRRQVAGVLGQYGTAAIIDDRPQIMALPRLVHLHSRIEADIDNRCSDAEILPALHPTPAVAGMPKEASIEAIEHLEEFDRGWYAGPVGCIGADGAEFAVAIRSGLLHGREMHLYSGAGIVPGSDAQAEWEEIELKLGNFLTLLQERP